MPSTKGFTQHKDLSEIQWKNSGETGGGGIMKNEMPSQKWRKKQTAMGAL
jgi:hypothetical protein